MSDSGDRAVNESDGVSGNESSRSPWFMALVYLGGVSFGFGLAYSGMTRPEVVLDFLQLEDLGLAFVMGGAAVVVGLAFALGTGILDQAPVTGRAYTRRLKDFDRNVIAGGAIFGAGWGLAGLCPGAAYASLGTGNYPVLLSIAGMFLGAYAQGYLRSVRTEETETANEPTPSSS